LGPGKAEEVRVRGRLRSWSPRAAEAGGRALTAQRWALALLVRVLQQTRL